MKTAKEYASEYRQIASNLGMRGDSVELLVQMLAHFTYTNGIDNLTTINEASLERAIQMNSKIQHCVEHMYSVFRGRCPRVILRFRPTKFFEFGIYDKVVSTNSFNLYYLGYLSDTSVNVRTGLYNASLGQNGGLGFNYAPVTIQPSENGYYTIICLAAKETVRKRFSLTANNIYYVDITEDNLSEDEWVKISKINNGSLEYIDTTNEFNEHLLNDRVFDLTLPNWGSRYYVPEEYQTSNTNLDIEVFKYCTVDDLVSYDINNIKLQGAELVSIQGTDKNTTLISKLNEVADGVILLPELERENISTIHYKANQNRYMNSIFRSNSDISELLKSVYPLKVKSTSFKFLSANEVETEYKKSLAKIPDTDLIIRSDITKYSNSDRYVDFEVNKNTIHKISVEIDKTNEETPSSTVYSLKAESPVCYPNKEVYVYAVKTYLDEDGDLVDKVIAPDDFDSEGLLFQYCIGNSAWTTSSNGYIPPITEENGKGKTIGIKIYDKSVSSRTLLDLEYLPFITSDTTYFGITDKNIVIPASGRSGFYRDYSESPIKIPSVLFIDGSSDVADEYTIESSSKELGLKIDENGVIYINNISNPITDKMTAVISATKNNIRYSSTLTVSTTLNANSSPRRLKLFYKISTGVYELLEDYSVWSGDTLEINNIQELLPITNTERITLAFGCNSSTFTELSRNVVNREPQSSISANVISAIKSGSVIDRITGRTSANITEVKGRGFDSSNFTFEVPQTTTQTTVTAVEDITPVNENVKEIILSKVYLYNKRTVSSSNGNGPQLKIYYIPQNSSDLLNDEEKKDFIKSRSAYYITNNIDIQKGTLINIIFNIKAVLYQNGTVDSEINKILNKYKDKFGLDVSTLEEDILSQINKIENIAKVTSFVSTIKSESGELLKLSNIDTRISYFNFSYYITTDLA